MTSALDHVSVDRRGSLKDPEAVKFSSLQEVEVSNSNSLSEVLASSPDIAHDDEFKLDVGPPLVLMILQNVLLQVSCLADSVYPGNSTALLDLVLFHRVNFCILLRASGRLSNLLRSRHRYSNRNLGSHPHPTYEI